MKVYLVVASCILVAMCFSYKGQAQKIEKKYEPTVDLIMRQELKKNCC